MGPGELNPLGMLVDGATEDTQFATFRAIFEESDALAQMDPVMWDGTSLLSH